MMVLPALVAALGGASAADPGAGQAWPPQAWEDGDLSDLSLVELALLASDLVPSKENRRSLERGLAPLEEMPSEHTDVTRIVLEGLAKARWHQERALDGLDDRQRAILASADPDRPTPPGWDEVMAAVDHRELGKALLALESSSTRAVAILQGLHAEPSPTLAGTLSDALGLPAPTAGPGLPAPPPAGATAALAAQVAGGLDPREQASLSDALDAVPPQARAALHTILEALVPLAGAPVDADAALVRLGAAVDDARDTLRIWSTAAMAERVHHVHTGPGIAVPDADADLPPLHFGVPRLRDPAAALPPPPGLAEALREVALALGDAQTARDAEAHVEPLVDALDPEAREAVAQVLHQTARHLAAQRTAAIVPAPPALAADPGLLSTWAGLSGGDIPHPGSPEAQALLAARPYLAARLEAALAREDLMTAVQDAVAALAPQPQPASSPLPGAAAPASGHEAVPCDLERIRIPQSGPALLHIDPCGHDDAWEEDDRALLVIDTGGDDTYEGAYGSAPLPLGTVLTQGPIVSPVAIHLDLGGSDLYDAGGLDCALGAACAPTGSDRPHLAVLVDWQGDDADVRNEFRSGDRSQGYAGDGTLPGTGLLVERAGARSRLASEYVGGDHSQGAAGLDHGAIVLGSSQAPGVGALLRMVGEDADAAAGFQAGDHSQGSIDLQGILEQTAVAALVNVAGPDASSPDRYVAGNHGQGAVHVWTTGVTARGGSATALFVDAVGSGGRSDDQYRAGDGSRAHGENAYFLDILLPPGIEREGLVETPLLDGPEAPGQNDLPPEGPPGVPTPGVDPSDPSASATVASTGPRSSSNDTYLLVGVNPEGNGFATDIRNAPPLDVDDSEVTAQVVRPVLFLDLGGNDTYPEGSAVDPRNDGSWVQPAPPSGNPLPTPTGIDNSTLVRDADGDLLPHFVEDLLGFSDRSGDDAHPTGRRVFLDLDPDRQAGFLNTTHALVISLAGDTTYGAGFSSGVLLDLGGNDRHLGRTAAATGPTTAPSHLSPQNLVSFTLDLEGGDHYESAANGTMGFGAGGAVGILFDLGGGDRYHGVNHTQGVGMDGGLGVLVDLKGPTLESETNRFRADGGPAQGAGAGGGVGILVADGDHNTFDDGGGEAPLLPGQTPDEVRDAAGDPAVPIPDGLRSNGGGASYNGGDNAAPVILASDWTGSAAGHAVAGVPYTFTATVHDPDDDRLDVCWTATGGLPDEDGVLPQTRLCRTVEGEGTVEVEHAWLDVPTDARDDENDASRDYSFDLTVTDPGGMEDRVDNPTAVFNDPPELTGEAMRTPQTMAPGTRYAIQLPFVPSEDMPDPDAEAVLVTDWGDGLLEQPESFNATAVDWAEGLWGARIETPRGFPSPLVRAELAGSLDHAIDGDPDTRVAFTHQRHLGEPFNAPATVVVWLEGVRQVRQVSIDASRLDQSSAATIHLSMDAVQADGSTFPVGTATLEADRKCDPCTWDLPDFPDVTGLILRQVVAPGERHAASHAFDLASLSARGPGATHMWGGSGTHDVDYTVLDRYGGRNGTVTPLPILSDVGGGGEGGAPLRLLDIGGRGPARHASLAANPVQPQTLTLESLVSAQGDEFCIDWGDGTVDCGEDDAGIPVPDGDTTESQKTWTQSSDDGHDVELIYYPSGRPADGSGGERWPLTTVHVEQGLDLRAGDSTPLLFLAFEVERATWHEGLVDGEGVVTPYQAIVDAGGNDRYLGRVASSLPLPTIAGPGPSLPSLVADGGGDDVYLSTVGRAQAFATHLGVSLLLDVGGSDLYVAGDEAQAAATRGGATALLSLGGGRDVFNPVPADHPDVAAASPRAEDLWMDVPAPDTLLGGRSVGAGPDLVQGASEDGVAILVTAGGFGVFHAGARSQGHGSHEARTVDDYAIPGEDLMCGPPISGIQQVDPTIDVTEVACLLGITNVRDPLTDPDFYIDADQNGVNTPATPSQQDPEPDQLLCNSQSANPLSPPVETCPGRAPDRTTLSTFLTDHARYGPGLGALVRLEGPALYHADREAQGSAGSAGRGLLLDLDGGSALLARERAQAFSVAGTAGTVLGGPSVLRLGGHGQATFQEEQNPQSGSVTGQAGAGLEGPEGGLADALQTALLLTLGTRDAGCGDPCGPSGDNADREQDHAGPSRPPVPVVTVDAPPGPISHTGAETVTVEVEDSAPGEDVRVVVFAIAYPEWSDGPNPTCGGAPMTAPTLVLDDVGQGIHTATLDLGALAGGTDPLLPAGCTEVHAFARPLPQDVGGSQVPLEWGHGRDTVLLLPPVRGMRILGANGLNTNGVDPVAFDVQVPEPLAMGPSGPPQVGFRVSPGGWTSGFVGAFQGSGVLSVEWTPPTGLQEGSYVLEARARWRPGADWSAWADLGAEVLVDRNAPIVSVDPASIPQAVRYQQEITLRGDASDTSGVDAVAFRLLNEGGQAVPMQTPCAGSGLFTPPLHQALGEDEANIACAQLDGSGDSVVEWKAAFRPSDFFAAGSLRIEYNALDGGGAVGEWQEFATVLVDNAAPRVTDVRTPDGFEAAGPTPEDGNSSVRLRVHLCDGATTDDACGADGVDLTTVAVSAARITEDGSLERVPLERAPDLDPDGSGGDDVVLGYDWTSGEEIPEGTYDLFILARDRAGNLFDHNPARPFAVDRTPPDLDEPEVFLPEMTRPDGEVVPQQAVKEADTLHLVVAGQESNPSTLAARIPGTDGPPAEAEAPWTTLGGQTFSLVVPPGADGGTGVVEVEVEAVDLAGNAVTRTVPVPFATPFGFLDGPDVDARSDSALVSWSLTRALDGPGDGLLATLLNTAGSPLHQAVPGSPAGDASYQVRFPDLEPGRDYQVLLQAWDGANNTLETILPLTTFEEPKGTDLEATTSTTPTYAGLVAIEGRLTAGAADIRGDLSLHAGDPDGAPLPFLVGPDPADDAEPVEGLLLETSLGERQDFTLLWDSSGLVPAGAGAQTVDLHVRFDDGSTTWTDVLSLRVDNTPPAIAPAVEGPAPNDGWYNGTVVVRGVAGDDTERVPPAPEGSRPNLRYRTAVVGGAEAETDAVTLTGDGVHEVVFTVSDGAVPPNVGTLSTTVRLDRTPPGLDVESGLDAPWTNQPRVPVSVQAGDDGSGLDGFRVRVGDGDWSTTTSAPTEVSLEGLSDGEYWIDIDVHDKARNAQRETLNVLLDRAAPSVVDARWVGWSQGVPVLHLVAEDRLDSEGRPSGVDAVRLATGSAGGPWTDWSDTGVSGVFPVEGADGGAWLQLRDRAGNVASSVAVDAPPAEEQAADPGEDTPSSALLAQATVAPEEGGPQTRFTFSVLVRPVGGALPDEVVLHVADQTHPMLPEGPVLEGGGRVHTATITLPPSRLDGPHTFHVTAHYGDQVVQGGVEAGPTVYALGLREPTTDGAGAEASAAGLGLFILLLTSLVLYRRRDRP